MVEINAAERLLAYSVRKGISRQDHEFLIEDIEEAFASKRAKIKSVKTAAGFTIQIANVNKSYYIKLMHGKKIAGYTELMKYMYGESTYTPHSILLPEYQGKGWMAQIYRWFMDAGIVLMTEGGHTTDAAKMWNKLEAAGYKSYLVDFEKYMGPVTNVVPYGDKKAKLALKPRSERILCRDYSADEIYKSLRKRGK